LKTRYPFTAVLLLVVASSSAYADTTTITVPFNKLFSSVGQAIQRVVGPKPVASQPTEPAAPGPVPSSSAMPSTASAAEVRSAQDAWHVLRAAVSRAPLAIRNCMRNAITDGNIDASSLQRDAHGDYSAHMDGNMVMMGLLAYYEVSPQGHVEVAADCSSTGKSIGQIGQGKLLTVFTTYTGAQASAGFRQWVLDANNRPIEPHTVAVYTADVHRVEAMDTFLRGG
jgi:hypothetical protein